MYKTFTLEERQEIAQANILAKSYFDQIAQNFKNYSEFVALLKKDYSKIYDMLPSNLKSKFFDDVMILKLPLKYEDKMQDVCKGIILTAVKQRSFNGMDYDEAYIEGMIGADKALWMYRDSAIKLQTYAMTCARSRLADYREKQFNSKKKAKEYGFEDFDKAPITKEEKYLGRAFRKNTTVVDAVLDNEEAKIKFDDLINMACSDELDLEIVKNYLENNRKGSESVWVVDVIQFFEGKTGKPISANAVRKRLAKIQQRAKDIADKKGFKKENIVL
jgi:hypothetical protein